MTQSFAFSTDFGGNTIHFVQGKSLKSDSVTFPSYCPPKWTGNKVDS